MAYIYGPRENLSAVWMTDCVNWRSDIKRTTDTKWLTWWTVQTIPGWTIFKLGIDGFETIARVSRLLFLQLFGKSWSFLGGEHVLVAALESRAKWSISFLLRVCPSSFSISVTWIDFIIKFLSQSLRLRKHIRVMILEPWFLSKLLYFMLRQCRVSH